MKIEYHKWYSPVLNQEMELNIYGYGGKPVLVFPAERGNFHEYEGFGMIEACKEFINSGKIQIFTIDGLDSQTWCNYNVHPSERVKRYNEYNRYVTEEVIPFIHYHTNNSFNKFLITGCSMGGYHASNFFFRYPQYFDILLSVSGVYSLKLFIKDYIDSEVFFHIPIAYLPNLNDEWYLNQYRESKIILSVGQGAWEDDMIEDIKVIEGILKEKNIPAFVDYWGYDVNHDWIWWRKQVPYFLNILNL